jgi:CBS domain containing-hemolysin-like protein
LARLDEHGSFAGVVTTEDILEQMIGEIRDARDSKTQPFQRLDDRRIVVHGTMEIDHFNEVFDTQLRDDEHETIALRARRGTRARARPLLTVATSSGAVQPYP